MRLVFLTICLSIAGLTSVVAENGEPAVELIWDGPAIGGSSRAEPVPAARELSELIDGAGDLSVGEITVNDLLQVAELASVAHQQEMHVRKSAGLSLLVPGLGHYLNGKTGAALGFFAADVAIHGTVAVLGYFLLPASVQFANLNYLQTPIVDIETRWKDLTFGQFLPTAAVAVSGSILSAVVRHLASRDARDVAVRAVTDGTVVFEPVMRP